MRCTAMDASASMDSSSAAAFDFTDMFDDPDFAMPSCALAVAEARVATVDQDKNLNQQNDGLPVMPFSVRSRGICSIQKTGLRRLRKRQEQLKAGVARVNKGSMYSKGTKEERTNWSLRLQLKKAEKKLALNECSVLELLTSLQKRSQHGDGMRLRILRRGRLFSKRGLINAAAVKASGKGNRFVSSYSMTDFLETSFGKLSNKKRIKQRNALAVSSEMGPRTVSTMQMTVACAVMARQARILANLYKLCKKNPPTVFAMREAFDETGHKVTVNLGFGNETAVSQICVVHHYLVICWLIGGEQKMMCMPLVIPPLLVLTPSAPQLYYATTNHPMLHTIRSFERLITETAGEQILLQETDSATANDRLYHFKLNRFDGDRALRECMPCLNHQVTRQAHLYSYLAFILFLC